MKKKTAITLAALALLSVGVTLGPGVALGKKHNKDDQKKAEKELKDVLIPNAERELDSLMQKQDTAIVSYVEQLQKLDSLNQKQDSVDSAIYKQAWHLDTLLNDLSMQWQDKVVDALHDAEIWLSYDGITDMEWSMPENLSSVKAKKIFYLTGNASSWYPTVPVEGGKTVLTKGVLIPDVFVALWDAKGLNVPNYDARTADLEKYFFLMNRYAAPVIIAAIEGKPTVTIFRDSTEILQDDPIFILESLADFLNKIDNSGHAFDNKTLQDLRNTVGTLLTLVGEKTATAKRIDSANKKTDKLKNARSDIQNKIISAKEEADKLKKARNSMNKRLETMVRNNIRQMKNARAEARYVQRLVKNKRGRI